MGVDEEVVGIDRSLDLLAGDGIHPGYVSPGGVVGLPHSMRMIPRRHTYPSERQTRR